MLPLFSSRPLTVSELADHLQALLDADPLLSEGIWVEGEVTGARNHRGHWYFSLTDGQAQIDCVLFRGHLSRYEPLEGHRMLAFGYVRFYAPRGRLQLYVERLAPLGEGALAQARARLLARLEAEGLFAAERKRPLPPFPRRIGVVTSPTGAAFRDILRVLSRRYPLVEVVLSPARVQGDGADRELIQALRNLTLFVEGLDLVILSRGGGSAEDLAAFDSEALARAVYACPVPVVTGVGHEIDTPVVDYVADRRAPTPSAAAEVAVPDRADLEERLGALEARMESAWAGEMARRRAALAGLEGRLAPFDPARRLAELGTRLAELARRLDGAWTEADRARRARLEALAGRLEALSPQAVLERGFALLEREDGRLVRSTDDVTVGQRLRAHLARGRLGVRVEEKAPVPQAEPLSRPPDPPPSPHGEHLSLPPGPPPSPQAEREGGRRRRAVVRKRPSGGDPHRRRPWPMPAVRWHTLKGRARELRRKPTPAEALLWSRLRRRQLGVRFRRQHAIDRFIVDFYCAEARLIVEVDGDVHDLQPERDEVRQAILEALGYRVLRFRNEEVMHDLERVVEEIRREVETRQKQK